MRARRRKYFRVSANPNRVSQRIWAMLRLLPAGATTEQIAAVTAAPTSTTKHLLRRWCGEGLVEVVGEVGGGGGLKPAYIWRLARDLGPVAPVLRGQVLTGSGYTDPNLSP